MPTWYVVRKYENLPEAIEVVKETPKTVTYTRAARFHDGVVENRIAKLSEYIRLFETKKEAIDYLITRTANRLNTASKECNKLKQALMTLEDMRREEEGIA